MPKIEQLLEQVSNNPKGVRYKTLCMVCDHFFGNARSKGTSHRIYKTPWPGDPRVNIQDDNGYAKYYQVKQVLLAIKILKQQI